MEIKKTKLRNLLGCAYSTMNTYLGRYEFAHIIQCRGKCINITKKDIDKLKIYVKRKN